MLQSFASNGRSDLVLLLSEYTTKVNRDTCWFINQNQKYTDITICPHQAPVVQQYVRGVGLSVEADQVQVLVNVDQLSICVCSIVCYCEALMESSAGHVGNLSI